MRHRSCDCQASHGLFPAVSHLGSVHLCISPDSRERARSPSWRRTTCRPRCRTAPRSTLPVCVPDDDTQVLAAVGPGFDEVRALSDEEIATFNKDAATVLPTVT